MPNTDRDIPLPADAKDLTRELALRCCTNPQVLYDAFARLAAHPAPFSATHTYPTPAAAPARGKAQANAR
jgi:hypothetical protein